MRILCSSGSGGAALLRQGTCRASATDYAGPTAGDTKSGGPPPWGGGHTVGEKTQTTAGPGHGTGPGAGTQARKGGSDPPPPLPRGGAVRRRALPSTGEEGPR